VIRLLLTMLGAILASEAAAVVVLGATGVALQALGLTHPSAP
jgi:hypothetical protein